jgi:hypothetical protein
VRGFGLANGHGKRALPDIPPLEHRQLGAVRSVEVKDRAVGVALQHGPHKPWGGYSGGAWGVGTSWTQRASRAAPPPATGAAARVGAEASSAAAEPGLALTVTVGAIVEVTSPTPRSGGGGPLPVAVWSCKVAISRTDPSRSPCLSKSTVTTNRSKARAPNSKARAHSLVGAAAASARRQVRP